MNKKHTRDIKKFCDTLPESFELRKHKEYMKGAEMDIETKRVMVAKGVKIDPNAVYHEDAVYLFPINHYKRVKKLYASKHTEEERVEVGIQYGVWVNNNNIKVNKYLEENKIKEGWINRVKGWIKGIWSKLIVFIDSFTKADKTVKA